jgi:hypothetical protein
MNIDILRWRRITLVLGEKKCGELPRWRERALWMFFLGGAAEGSLLLAKAQNRMAGLRRSLPIRQRAICFESSVSRPRSQEFLGLLMMLPVCYDMTFERATIVLKISIALV